MRRSYDYSPIYRACEVAGIAAVGVLLPLMTWQTLRALWGVGPGHVAWLLPLKLVGGYLAADLFSGIVHFIFDTFGTEKTPVLGPAFIRPFREHHVDPQAICRHDFIELNGANAIVTLPVLLATHFLVPLGGLGPLALRLFVIVMVVGVLLTNQFHRWAHEEHRPGWVRRLQAAGVILDTAHHERHHTPPYKTNYCITTGWCNAMLDRVGVFRALERLKRGA